MSNAIKYADLNKEKPQISIEFDIDNHFGRFKIEDNGVGIRRDHLENIFEMFYRASPNSKGSGIGLYIVKEIINKLEGSISVDSELSVGTTFTINIPNKS